MTEKQTVYLVIEEINDQYENGAQLRLTTLSKDMAYAERDRINSEHRCIGKAVVMEALIDEPMNENLYVYCQPIGPGTK